jgi:lysophospholipase L1-like esterase
MMPAPTTTSLGLPLGTRPAGTPIAPVLTGTIRVYAVGDSFTQGGSDSSNGNSGLAWRQYVAEMADAAGIVIEPVGNLASVAPDWPHHRAIFGEPISDFITDFNATPALISDADPDVVMMCPLGYNDLAAGVTGANTLLLLEDLLEIFRAFTNGRGVSPRIVCSYLMQRNAGTAGEQGRIDDFNAGLAALVAAQQGLGQLIALTDPRPYGNNPAGTPTNRADGFHPNDGLYRLIAREYFAGICNAIGINAQWGRPTS